MILKKKFEVQFEFHLHVCLLLLPKEDSGEVLKMTQVDFNVDAADVVSSWIAQTE